MSEEEAVRATMRTPAATGGTPEPSAAPSQDDNLDVPNAYSMNYETSVAPQQDGTQVT